MNVEKVTESLYTYDSVLPFEKLIELNDEFEFKNNHLMLKNSGTGSASFGIKKPFDHADRGIGDNPKFLSVSTRLKLIAEHTLHKKLDLVRINSNIQLAGQNTSFHKDGVEGTWTFVLFTQFEWNSEWGGEFICSIGGKYFYVPYIPNTGCLFASHNDHRGSLPSLDCTNIRTSLACSFLEV